MVTVNFDVGEALLLKEIVEEYYERLDQTYKRMQPKAMLKDYELENIMETFIMLDDLLKKFS